MFLQEKEKKARESFKLLCESGEGTDWLSLIVSSVPFILVVIMLVILVVIMLGWLVRLAREQYLITAFLFGLVLFFAFLPRQKDNS